MSEPKHESTDLTRLVTADERDQAVKRLTAAFADDAIAVDEFERRVSEVYRVESPKALAEITRDLPAPAAAGGEGSALPAPVDERTSLVRPPSRRLSATLGSVERTLQGPMPESLDVRAVVGSVEVDLRRADFPPGVTEIRVRSILGNIELELPAHVRVENDGHALLGNFSVKGRTRSGGQGGEPIVRITGRSILANVEVELDD